jgi:hypothetical protein
MWYQYTNKYSKLTKEKLKEALLEVTISVTGSASNIDLNGKALLLGEYFTRAFPKSKVLEVLPTNTSAALNSVSGKLKVEFSANSGETMSIFAKIHIEGEKREISFDSSVREYSNAKILENAGWPVIKPIFISQNLDYPLLVYPIVENETLFELLEESNIQGEDLLTNEQYKEFEDLNRSIGECELKTLNEMTSQEAMDAPVQLLFNKRLIRGGRVDVWYKDDTIIKLPGLTESISWDELKLLKWVINGKEYPKTLDELIESARLTLKFNDDEKIFSIISHGDDHAGNVKMTSPIQVFDPAVAGRNPAGMDLKALAHTGLMPLGAMYYLPKELKVIYQINGNVISVISNISDIETYSMHEKLGRIIFDSRLLPIVEKIKSSGGNIQREIQRIKDGLSMCALLTVNIPLLLQQGDGRGSTLLPISLMCNELAGLPLLEYIKQEIDKS